jgi:hypothetical protein
MEMIESNNLPHELGAQKYSGYGQTAGLMLCVLNAHFGAGNYRILDSGFCVLKAPVKLKRRGIHVWVLIKKPYSGEPEFKGP